MSLRQTWNAFDHYAYGVIAVVGTALGIAAIVWAMTTPLWGLFVGDMHLIAAPFMNILGVLFGLTLAFLANDTWSAHAQARTAILREADAIRGLDVLIAQGVGDSGADMRSAVRAYAEMATKEWQALARCETLPEATRAADELLRQMALVETGRGATGAISKAMLDFIMEIRTNRGTRVGLSRTHVNPLKWLSMAFLGFLTLITIAVIQAGHPVTAMIAMSLFGIAAAPTAAIVLIHGNPFQPPYAVSPDKLLEALGDA